MNFQENIYFGKEGDFATVRRIKMHGSHFQIGKEIGRIAVERYGETLDKHEGKPDFAEARRKYFQHNCPYLWERMRGVAASLGVDPENDRFDVTTLPFLLDVESPLIPGCSSVYYPPSATTAKKGFLSKNFDFSTGSVADMAGIQIPTKQSPIASEPYIMEWYPTDGGYSSISINIYDLLSGPADGINSAGLVVSMFADEEAMGLLGKNIERNDIRTPQVVGLHAPQVLRHILDTCSTVQEAKNVLFTLKQYYPLWPSTCLIADVSGNSFIYEDSTYRNTQHIINRKGKVHIITNFQVHSHPTRDSMPDEFSMDTNAFWRYKRLEDLTSGHDGSFSIDDMKENQHRVNILEMFKEVSADPDHKGIAAASNARTLWHSLYDQNEKSMEVNFYLNDESSEDGARKERRSDYLKFVLNPDN